MNLSDASKPGSGLVPPVKMTIYNQHSTLGNKVVSSEDVSGSSFSKTLPAGYYSVVVEGDNYNKSVSNVLLDKS